MSTRISVIVAAYRGEAFIAEQLRSLFTQTRVPDEIVIGDDSRDGGTEAVVESVRGEYGGDLRYVRNPRQLGVVANFLNLARLATGDLIFFSDQDDVWLPKKIEVLSERLLQEESCQVVVCNSELVDRELRDLHEKALDYVEHLSEKSALINSGHLFFPMQNLRIGFYGHNMAMKRSYLEVFQQMPANFFSHDMWLEYTGCYLGVLRYVDQVLTLYRIHGGNLSNPQSRTLNWNFRYRFREVVGSAKDVITSAGILVAFMPFAERYPDHPELGKVVRFRDYFVFRAGLLHRSRLVRPLLWLCHPGAVASYFREGLGVRSMVRDLLSPRFDEGVHA